MNAHTPGPWTYRAADRVDGSPQTFQAIVYGADNNHYVADIFGASREGVVVPWEANARLIAASPKLLRSLKVLVETYSGDDPARDAPILMAAREAIAEAEGRS